MKQLLSLLFIALGVSMFTGCSDQVASTENASKNDSTQSDQVSVQVSDQVSDQVASETTGALLGNYVGDFKASKYNKGKNPSYSNRINVVIEQLSNGKVSGHSVVAGNSRPFSGTYTMKGEDYEVVASEPGDDKYDGKFAFTLMPKASSISGTWTANDSKLAVYERTFTLEQREFKYDPSLALPEDVRWTDLYGAVKEPEWQRTEITTEDVTKFNASKDKLTKEDVENMYKGDLEILRNSIYARHGYSFKNRKMRYVFDSQVPWYIPMSTDVSKELTKLEVENIELIKRYEEHAETYYDEFGR